MPIKIGTSSLSPVVSDINQYAADRLPISADNGEIIYCPDGNGYTIPNSSLIAGAYGFRKDNNWKNIDNSDLVANSAALWSGAFAQFDPTAAGNGPFNPQIIDDITSGGVRKRRLYIDITFAGLTFRIFCLHSEFSVFTASRLALLLLVDSHVYLSRKDGLGIHQSIHPTTRLGGPLLDLIMLAQDQMRCL